MPYISGFYKLSVRARIAALRQYHFIDAIDALTSTSTPIPNLNRMSENVISSFELPLSVLPCVVVNGLDRAITMATEEPSVVAAANRAASLFAKAGGTKATVDKPVTRAQIMFAADSLTAANVIPELACRKQLWIDYANDCDPNLIKAGGGVDDISFNIAANGGDYAFIIANLDVFTVDAMGANAVNTMAECLLKRMTDTLAECCPTAAIEPGMAIVSNASPRRLVHAHIELPYSILDLYKKDNRGHWLAHRIELASRFAEASPERAVTHNKGILNGVAAAAIPLGQDIRALDTAAIDYACSSGSHKPLTTWRDDHDKLIGHIDMPILAGIVGGSRNALPKIDAAYALAHINSYDDLTTLLASIGLAQNFAALAALMTDGIQAGHMRLHRRKNGIF